MSQPIIGVGNSSSTMGIERFARVISMQKNAADEAGKMALKLIQSAALPPGQGANLDVSA